MWVESKGCKLSHQFSSRFSYQNKCKIGQLNIFPATKLMNFFYESVAFSPTGRAFQLVCAVLLNRIIPSFNSLTSFEQHILNSEISLFYIVEFQLMKCIVFTIPTYLEFYLQFSTDYLLFCEGFIINHVFTRDFLNLKLFSVLYK
jgi:hypothetical protein